MVSSTNLSGDELMSQSEDKTLLNLTKYGQDSTDALVVNQSFEGNGAKFPLNN